MLSLFKKEKNSLDKFANSLLNCLSFSRYSDTLDLKRFLVIILTVHELLL